MLSLLHSLTVFNKHKHEEYMDNIYISYISCIYMYILLGLCFIVVGRE